MKNLLVILSLIITVLFFYGCNSGGGGGSNESINSSNLISGTFVDTSATNFTYSNSNVAMLKIKSNLKKGSDLIIPRAYAAVNEPYSCYTNQNINVEVVALGNTVTTTTSCSSAASIDLNIRRALLESLDGQNLKRTVTDAAYKNGIMDFNTSGFSWNTSYYVVEIYKADDAGSDFADPSNPGNTDRPCWAAYLFNLATGKVAVNTSILVSEMNNPGDVAIWCSDGGETIVDFRFINGYMEMDWSGDNEFSLERGRFADGHAQENQACYDAIANNDCESTYEKWEIQ